MNYGETLKNILKEKKIKQIELANMANLSRSYVSEILSNKKNITIPVLENLCEKLDIDIVSFMFKAVNDSNKGKNIPISNIKQNINLLSSVIYG